MHMHCYAVKISKMDAYNDSTIVHARAVLAALRREWREGSRHMSERLTRPPVKELRLRRELELEKERAAAEGLEGLVAAAALPPSSSSRISPTAFFSSRVRARPTYSPRWRQLRTWRYPHFPVSAAIALTRRRREALPILAALEAVAHVEVPALPRVRGDRLDEEAEGGLAHTRHLGHVQAVRVAARHAELLLVGERGAAVVDDPPVRVGEPAVLARALAPELARRHGEAEAAGRLALPGALPPRGVGGARPPAERRVHLEGGRAVGDGAAAGGERGAARRRDAGARAVGIRLVGVLGGDGAGEGEHRAAEGGAALPGAGVGVERGGGGVELVLPRDDAHVGGERLRRVVLVVPFCVENHAVALLDRVARGLRGFVVDQVGRVEEVGGVVVVDEREAARFHVGLDHALEVLERVLLGGAHDLDLDRLHLLVVGPLVLLHVEGGLRAGFDGGLGIIAQLAEVKEDVLVTFALQEPVLVVADARDHTVVFLRELLVSVGVAEGRGGKSEGHHSLVDWLVKKRA